MKVWITKYALTSGITVAEGRQASEDPDIIILDTGRSMPYSIYFHKSEWHKSFAEAAVRAEEMRIKKIASLKRQLAKLEAMRFRDG